MTDLVLWICWPMIIVGLGVLIWWHYGMWREFDKLKRERIEREGHDK